MNLMRYLLNVSLAVSESECKDNKKNTHLQIFLHKNSTNVHFFSNLFPLYTAATAESSCFVHLADFALLMLLVLTEHPCYGQHNTLLANSIAVPTAVAGLLTHVRGREPHRACEILNVEVEYQAFFCPHLSYSEVHVECATLLVIACCQR